MRRESVDEALRRVGKERPTAPLELWEGIETRVMQQAQRPPSVWRGRLGLALLLVFLGFLATRPELQGLLKGKMTLFYQVLLAIGGLGLLVQAALGFAHSDSGGGHDHGHAGHALHEVPHALMLLSPLRIFGIVLGIGATGLLLQILTKLPSLATLLLALLAGVVFYHLAIQPLYKLVLQFASNPAKNLTMAKGQDATADSRFDAQGRGIVTVVIDGQLVRLLATLDGEPQPVEAGEKLLVVSVDTKRNQCKVVKL